MLETRDKFSAELQMIIDKTTKPWGVNVLPVDVKDLIIPTALVDADVSTILKPFSYLPIRGALELVRVGGAHFAFCKSKNCILQRQTGWSARTVRAASKILKYLELRRLSSLLKSGLLRLGAPESHDLA